jgi:hypothetical protein
MEKIEIITIHPPFNKFFTSSDHPLGHCLSLGDALGKDCVVQKLYNSCFRLYRNDGNLNEDWFTWNEPVLAPCNAVVKSIHIDTEPTNIIGMPIKDRRATLVIFECQDETNFLYAHLQDIQVTIGDRVTAGQFFARVGNNGNSSNPHLHIGAYKGIKPLAIAFDQSIMGEQLHRLKDKCYFEDF